MNLPTHIALELWGVEAAVLNDAEVLVATLKEAAVQAKCEVLGELRHQFVPHGATAMVLLSTSHLSIHTWPEHNYALVDLLTCGESLPDVAVDVLLQRLRPRRYSVEKRVRGTSEGPLLTLTDSQKYNKLQ
jgi:S-adenosylmethionine decarboxylase proenzyme